jgi:hypothetical protein
VEKRGKIHYEPLDGEKTHISSNRLCEIVDIFNEYGKEVKQGKIRNLTNNKGVSYIPIIIKEFIEERSKKTGIEGGLDLSVKIDRDFSKDKEVDPETFEENQEAAEQIGEAGEEHVLAYEIQELKSNGLAELAEQVRRVSLENVAAGFDVLSYYSEGDGKEGEEKYIEVKSTKSRHADFEITINELRTAKQHEDDYWIYRVRGVGTESVDVDKLQNPVKLIEEEDLLLQPTKFRVSLSEEIEG